LFHYYCNGKYHKNWGSLQQKTENQDSSINPELRGYLELPLKTQLLQLNIHFFYKKSPPEEGW
jgi:hypothetical protein